MATGHGPLIVPPAVRPAPVVAAVGEPRPNTRPPERAVALLIAALFLLLLTFVVFPLARVLGTGFMHGSAWSLYNYRSLFDSGAAGLPLWNSLRLAATVAVTGTVVGYVSAYVLTMVAIPGRRVFRFLALLPMVAPPFMIALAAIMLLGRNGVMTRHVLVPILGSGNVPEIYGFGGLVLVQTLTFFPVSMLLLVAVLSALDPALEEAAHSQGASPFRVFRRVILPLSMPGILSSMLLLFIESLADFGNPLILGGDFRVLSVAAFLRITGEFDTAGGAVLATLLLVPALIAFFVQKHFVSKLAVATLTGRPARFRQESVRPAARIAAAAVFTLVGGSVCVVYGAVIYGSLVEVWGVAGGLTLSNYSAAMRGSGTALFDSLLLASIATPFTGVLGMLIAWVVVRRTFRGRSLLTTLAMLTFAVPGTVVGIGYILAFNGPPIQLTGTAAIIVLLFVFRNAPVGIEAGMTAIRQVDPAIEEGAASLGASPFVTMRRVVVPIVAAAFFTGLAHAFARSMTAISAVIFVVSGQWNLVTVSILGFVENADLARAAALCMIVVVAVSAVLALVHVAVARLDPAR